MAKKRGSICEVGRRKRNGGMKFYCTYIFATIKTIKTINIPVALVYLLYRRSTSITLCEVAVVEVAVVAFIIRVTL